MIRGIGTDIVRIDRMERALARRGERLAERLLAAPELQEFHRSREPARFLAKRFAVKEAVLKALGTGLRQGLRWTDICMGHDALGKPLVVLPGSDSGADGTDRASSASSANGANSAYSADNADGADSKPLGGRALSLAAGLRCHVSLSDERDYVVAFSVVEAVPGHG